MKRWHWFHFALSATFIFFMSILVYATTIAYSRRSGTTGMDAAGIQKIRYDASHPSNVDKKL